MIKSTTGLVKLAEPPRIGPPAEMMRDARVAAVDEVLPEVYESGGLLYVGQLSDLQSADMARYEEEKDLIREKALFERREAFVAGWVDALVAHASVNDYAAARQVQQQQQDQEEEES